VACSAQGAAERAGMQKEHHFFLILTRRLIRFKNAQESRLPKHFSCSIVSSFFTLFKEK
jgi:hypothetical protein